jgi:hypothetical protein
MMSITEIHINRPAWLNYLSMMYIVMIDVSVDQTYQWKVFEQAY